MSYRLINRNGEFPNGGFKFIDPKTKMEFGEGDFYSVVRAIIAHRMANARIYPREEFIYLNFESVSAELDAAVCERIKNSNRFCESGEPRTLEPDAGSIAELMKKICYRCGSLQGFPVYCKTCAGKKLSGFVCAECKAPLGTA